MIMLVSITLIIVSSTWAASEQVDMSQRLATLVLYIAREYSNRIDFRCVKVSENGPPSKDYARRLEAQFSLDSTPGILFYDNSKNGLVLE